MQTILFLHQSADMYGSDKILLSLVAGLDKGRFRPIVILPFAGPLLAALKGMGIEAHAAPLVRVGRKTFTPLGILRLPFDALSSVRAIDGVLKGIRPDIVHSNTLAVLSGALWARLRKAPHLWHVHEIILHPAPARRLFPWLVKSFSDYAVANSTATLEWLVSRETGLAAKSRCVWNGIERTSPVDGAAVKRLRDGLGIEKGDVLVALVGRINRWKGQGVLVDAAEVLWKSGRRGIRYLMAGDAPSGQGRFKTNLLDRIAASPAREMITVMDFRKDVWTVWDACDIAVVPSTEPEPFGLVAVEAMAAGRPVIAARHGGLTEIVEDGETGFFFTPSDAVSLADKIGRLSNDPALRSAMGRKGKERQERLFSLRGHVAAFESVYEAMSGKAGA